MKAPPPDVVAAAQSAQTKYDILASISIAQFALESAWGTKLTGKNNPFGIKAAPDVPGTLCPTHEVVNGQRVAVMARFRDFPTMAEAFDYHACLLATAKPYAAARAVRHDYAAFAKALTGVYATDPNYGASLISLIEGNGLAKFDLPPAAAPATASDQAFGGPHA